MTMIPESTFVELGSALQPVIQFLEDSMRTRKRLDEVERGLQEKLRQLGLTLVEGYINAVGDGDLGPTIERDGRELNRSPEPHVKKYHSIFGRVNIARYVYAVREKQAAEYIPSDEQLKLPAGEQSYVLEDWSQRLTTNLAYGEARETLHELLGIDLSVRALEQMNQRMAWYVKPYWDAAPPPLPEQEGEILVVSADGKGIPMRQRQEDRYERELGKKKTHRASTVGYTKTDKRRGRGKRKSCKQMAYLGVVYSVDRFVRKPQQILNELQRNEKEASRPEPQQKRFRAEMNDISANEISYGQPRLFDWLAAEIEQRDPQQQKPVVCLMDGQKSLWYWKRERLARAVGILDIYHVMEWLWEAAHCFHPESSVEAEQFVHKYLAMMLEGNIGAVIGVFRRFANKLRGAKKKSLERVTGFFHRNKTCMRYDKYIQAGYPIGSGVVEGGCRHVVRDRMELSGMRWTVAGAQAMLRLRTTKLAGNWQPFVENRIQTELRKIYTLAS
jgi:hypothetical protein